VTKSQINKLGERLRIAASEEDSRLLNEFVISQEPNRLEVEAALRTLIGSDAAITSRLKTKTSILEKLRRQHTRLWEMQDVVGIRIVIPGSRNDQDNVVRRLQTEWPKNRLYDRRAQPQHGYRAVHVVPSIRGRPVEIQVRTPGQHQWAELFEKIADRWGREIRYGAPLSLSFSTKKDVVDHLQLLAGALDYWEAAQQEPAAPADVVNDMLATIGKHLDNLREQLLEDS